ncbi:MAG TPA: hypothetical protein VMW55_11040 [Nitrosopumilaceae archaeon]|jgi:hypothetical protein|nr:hypothetical protein [Nitrosopumilaceae archaeon]
MPAQGKVSLIRQTIYCFIPILDFYAAYHIKKLRWYLLIMLGVGFVTGFISYAVNPMPDTYDEGKLFLENKEINWEYAILGENPTLTLATMIIDQAIVLAVAVYLIRRWSKQWNTQLKL